LAEKDIEGTTLVPDGISFTGVMTIDLGGVTVEVRSLPHGHCPDNLVVWVPRDKVLFGGDLLFVGCHPFMGESDVQGWLGDLDVVASYPAEKIVPGHGRIAGAKDIAEMKAYVKTFDENALKLAKGKRQEDAPRLAQELLKRLPSQGRNELPMMLEYNLRTKYLPPADSPLPPATR
jgi:glyoxylase-like metal-dependent hydrolase (beta-lactamase superfamily II)